VRPSHASANSSRKSVRKCRMCTPSDAFGMSLSLLAQSSRSSDTLQLNDSPAGRENDETPDSIHSEGQSRTGIVLVLKSPR